MSDSASQEIEVWLQAGVSRTVGDIAQAFPEKSFAVLVLVLMLIPATPLPTGGVTHVFEIITMLVAVQIMIGAKRLWLPGRFSRISLSGKSLERLGRALHKLSRLGSRIRLPLHLSAARLKRAAGLFIFVYTLGAFLAPPFSGLDTLPALGAVLLALGLILDSIIFLAAGVLLGAAGIGIEIAIGRLIFKLL